MQIINLSREKLGYDLLMKCENYKNIIIESDTGTGKSTTIKHYLKEKNLKFISVTSRKSLALEHYRIFSEHGLDCQVYTDKLTKNKSSIFQLESLHKLGRVFKKDTFDYVLILDEVNSLIQHLITSPTITQRESRAEVMASLQVLIKSCKMVVAVDATISESVFKCLKFSDAKTCLIKNDFKNNQNVQAEELTTYEEMKNKILKTEKYMVCCDSANNAKALYEELNDDKIKLITAEVNESKTETINLDDYDKIIFSPKIIYGLDSTLKRSVFCYYTTRTIDAIQMYQQLSRTRSIKKLYFHFTDKPKFKRLYKNIDEVISEQMVLDEWIQEKYKLLGKCKIYELIQTLKNIQKFESDVLREDSYKSFIDILKSKGFNVTQKDQKVKQKTKSKKDILEAFHQKIFNYEDNIINKMMKLPEGEALKNINLLSDGYQFIKHINLIQYLEKTDDDINFSLCLKAYQSFPEDFVKSKIYKMNFLRKLISEIGATFEKVKVKNMDISRERIDDFNKQIKAMYPRNKTAIKNAYDIMKIIKVIIKDIFPEEVFKSVRYTYDKQANKQTFKLLLNENIKAHHLYMYSFRKQEANFVDDKPKQNIEDLL